MKKVAFAIIAVIGLSAIGWITFDFGGENPTVEIETETISDDTRSVIEVGKEVLHDTGEVLQEIGEE